MTGKIVFNKKKFFRNSSVFEPYIPSHRALPEITVKSIILGIALAVVMSGANAYLGLKIGLTVSATIPSAVISMTILRFFNNSNILENNIVQTTASAGEVIAAGTVFTLPALIMMNYWTSFPFWQTSFILAIGGCLGVLFSVPLRRALVIESKDLKFPEGIATGEVLKIGEYTSSITAKELVFGTLSAAFIKFSQRGLMVVADSTHFWTKIFDTVIGFGTGFPVVLIGAGYIVGINVGLSMLMGGIIAWVIAVPFYGYLYGVPDGNAYFAALSIWNNNIRMLGVGTMIVGGIWTIVLLIHPIKKAIKISFNSIYQVSCQYTQTKRTDRDIPISWVCLGIVVLMVPLGGLFYYIISRQNISISNTEFFFYIFIVSIFVVVIGFLASAIGGYMAGLFGSSNTPISGVTLMSVLLISLILYSLFAGKEFLDFKALSVSTGLASVAIIIGAVIACAAAVSCDNLQDLKAGFLVGSTPWKQQIMLVIGVLSGSLVMAPILQILFEAYGIGGVFPRDNMDPTQSLGAPKAAIMADIAQGIFSNSLNWKMILIGAVLGIISIIIDEFLKLKRSFWRFPTIALALGIYMPLDVTVPLFLGGVVCLVSKKRLESQKKKLNCKQYKELVVLTRRKGLLFSSGLIAGESVMGILLAIPFALYQTTDLFSIVPHSFSIIPECLGFICIFLIMIYLYRISSYK